MRALLGAGPPDRPGEASASSGGADSAHHVRLGVGPAVTGAAILP